jgi:RNA polymerase sigma factor (sigma-70 family)
MANTLSFDLLSELLSAEGSTSREVAWTAFVQAANKLLLHTAHSLGGGYDAAMDRYAFTLEQLRHDDFRRLRAFQPQGSGKLSTWLVIVARRLCLDYERQRYGRSRSLAPPERLAQAGRRRLVDLAGEGLDLDRHAAKNEADPLSELCAAELHRSLEQALASLSPQERLLLKLRYEDGLSASTIARAMHLPTPFHVYRRTARLLDGLRRSLAEQGQPNAPRSTGQHLTDTATLGQAKPARRSVP